MAFSPINGFIRILESVQAGSLQIIKKMYIMLLFNLVESNPILNMSSISEQYHYDRGQKVTLLH